MIPTWKQYEGQAVDGIPLRRLLGGSNASAVYAGTLAGKDCAIKLVPVEEDGAQTVLARWQQASKLSHPNLTRIEQWGRAKLNGQSFVYLAMEFGEEVLAAVDRPLTAKEAREMLAPTVSALAYIHLKGMAHGRIKPSNILSANETLKASGDSPVRAGEKPSPGPASDYDPPELATAGVTPAGDVWSLGVTLVESLTKQLPKLEAGTVELPASLESETFRQVALGCLQPDPALRWTVLDLNQWLERGVLPAPKTRKRRYVWAAGAAAGVVVAGLLAWPHLSSSSASSEPPAAASTSSTSAPASAAPASSAEPRQVAEVAPPKVAAEPNVQPPPELSRKAKREAKQREAKDRAAKEQAAREQAAQEKAAKEQALKNQALKNQALKDQAAKEQASKDQAAKQAELRAAEKKAADAKLAEAKNAKATPKEPQPEAAASPADAEPVTATTASDQVPSGVVQSVKPRVPAKARSTIHGKVPVYVRIEADAGGQVTGATIESGASSKYFSKLALEAAQQWKFAPAGEPQSWLVRFQFTRDAEKTVSLQASRLK